MYGLCIAGLEAMVLALLEYPPRPGLIVLSHEFCWKGFSWISNHSSTLNTTPGQAFIQLQHNATSIPAFKKANSPPHPS